MTPERIAKMANSKRGKSTHMWKSHPIVQIDPKVGIVGSYPSIGSAAFQTGIDRSSISRALSKQYKQAGGFVWQ